MQDSGLLHRDGMETNHSQLRTSREHWTAGLFLAGWILPSLWVMPFYYNAGIPLCFEEYDSPQVYQSLTYLTECGWFSRGVIVEYQWEKAGHGHTWPIGEWFLGWGLTFFVLITGIVGSYWPTKKLFVSAPWLLIAPIIIMLPFSQFSSEINPRTYYFAVAIYLVYFGIAWAKWRRIKQADPPLCIKSRNFVGLILLFYPVWVLTMCIGLEVSPFLGWVCTLAGCVRLLTNSFDEDQETAVQQSDG